MKKSVRSIVLSVMLLCVLLAGCFARSAEAAKTEGFPNRPITVIIPWTAGGGSDTGARLLAPYLEEKLGVPVSIVNQPGGNGWIGWTKLLQSAPDGYTIAIVNSTQLVSGWLDPAMAKPYSLDSFDFLANHVIDYQSISINAKETRFTDMASLLAYAKEHELTCATTGASSDEVVAMQKMNKLLGTKFIPVHLKGGADGMVAVMGGHVDVWIGNVSESAKPSKEGQVITVAVMAPERSVYQPTTPTLKEVTGNDITNWNTRAFAGPKGLAPEVKSVLEEAFNFAINHPQVKEKMDLAAQATIYKNGADTHAFLLEEENGIRGVAELLGWK